jgi:hypothetical protein
MKSPRFTARSGRFEQALWRVLTLEQLMTTSIAHLAYWIGLGLILLVGFAVIGGAVGAALREGAIIGWVLAIPAFVVCLLVVTALGILWRSFCELYVVLIRAGEDLNVMRRVAEAKGMVPREEPPAPSAYPELRENASATAQNADLGSP